MKPSGRTARDWHCCSRERKFHTLSLSTVSRIYRINLRKFSYLTDNVARFRCDSCKFSVIWSLMCIHFYNTSGVRKSRLIAVSWFSRTGNICLYASVIRYNLITVSMSERTISGWRRSAGPSGVYRAVARSCRCLTDSFIISDVSSVSASLSLWIWKTLYGGIDSWPWWMLRSPVVTIFRPRSHCLEICIKYTKNVTI